MFNTNGDLVEKNFGNCYSTVDTNIESMYCPRIPRKRKNEGQQLKAIYV